jgi:hypothetical protein
VGGAFPLKEMMVDTIGDSEHFKRIIAELPEDLRIVSDNRGYRLEVSEFASVTIDYAWHSRKESQRIKLAFSYSAAHDVLAKDRAWYRRKDGAFNYKLIAGYIIDTWQKMRALEKRRAAGKSIAKVRGEKLAAVFKRDTLLGALDLKIIVKPVCNTQTGEVYLSFRDRQENGPTFRFKSQDGNRFEGCVDVGCLSAAQVIALMAVLRLEKLNAIELISLADDSLLGPAIKAMIEEDEESDD